MAGEVDFEGRFIARSKQTECWFSHSDAPDGSAKALGRELLPPTYTMDRLRAKLLRLLSLRFTVIS
jgi:hypothetical protein